MLNPSNRSFRIAESLRHAGYSVVYIPDQGTKLIKILEFIQFMRKERPDLFLIDASGLVFITAYLISLLHRIPFTARMRGNIWDVFEEQKTYIGFPGLIYRYILIKMCVFILKRSHRVFPVSRALAEVLEKKGVQKERIRVLQYPVDYRKFHPSKKEKNRLTVLSVTNLSFIAKYGALVSVLPQIDEILTEYPNVYFVVAGGGKFFHNFEEAIRTMKNTQQVSYVGHCEAIEDLFAESDIFLHLSRLDGFPAAVVEAMSCELPVVANRYEAMMEQVEHGVTGFLVDNSCSLKDALALLITDANMRKEMGQKGRSHIKKNFSIEVIAGTYKREIEDVMNNV